MPLVFSVFYNENADGRLIYSKGGVLAAGMVNYL